MYFSSLGGHIAGFLSAGYAAGKLRHTVTYWADLDNRFLSAHELTCSACPRLISHLDHSDKKRSYVLELKTRNIVMLNMYNMFEYTLEKLFFAELVFGFYVP